MKKKLAFVLGGGGARGALQVGALRALQEAGIKPDLFVGTSAGAANAAHLAVNGFNHDGIIELIKQWHKAATADLLPPNYLWLTVRALFRRPHAGPALRFHNFWLDGGLKPDLKFGDLKEQELIIVSTDLNSGQPVLFGKDPEELILDALMASTAIPPWISPINSNGRLLIDGGLVSNLPIEPALSAGATEIVALDLCDLRTTGETQPGFGSFLFQVLNTVDQRYQDLERAIAKACNVPVTHIRLQSEKPVALWDFSQTDTLITEGYNQTIQLLSARPEKSVPWWNKLTKRAKT